jgi:PAS domain S-box-containing protein
LINSFSNHNNKLLEGIDLKSLLENLPQGIVILDGKGRIVFANRSFRMEISAENQQITGKDFISPVNESNRKEFKDLLRRIGENENGITFPITFNFETTVGSAKELKIMFTAAFDHPVYRKILLGVLAIDSRGLDLGKELQRQVNIKDDLKIELEKESELSEMKSRFLSIASHEFRTPLAGILSSINLINRYIKAEQESWSKIRNKQKIFNHLERVKESVRTLTNILDNFLALGNIEKGEIPVKYTEFNLYNVIEKQAFQLQNVCKEGQKIIHEHTGRDRKVKLDRNLLKNILNNLLTNAIKYSPENTEIRIASSVDTDCIKITVTDHGIGIPESEQDKIFRRFYRAKNSLPIGDGTGLGLNIVKKYTELLKGTIEFRSKTGEGSVFILTFPYQTP